MLLLPSLLFLTSVRAVKVSMYLLSPECPGDGVEFLWPEDYCTSWTDSENKIHSAFVHCDQGLASSSPWTVDLYENGDCDESVGTKYSFKGSNSGTCGLDQADPLIDLVAFKVDCGAGLGELGFAEGGDVQAAVDSQYPWDVKLSTVGSIKEDGSGKYVLWRYTEFAEVTPSGDVVPPDMTGSVIDMYHSVPVNNYWMIVIMALASWGQDISPLFASRIAAGELNQAPDESRKIKALLASYLAKQDFSATGFQAEVGPGGAETTVCFHKAKTPGGTDCEELPMTAGQFKTSVGFYNLQYKDPSSNSWRISADLLPEGLNNPSIYFNGDPTNTPAAFTGQVENITFTEGDDPEKFFTFTLSLRQKVNRGDNTEIDAAITAVANDEGGVTVSVTFALADLANTGDDGWWLWDPTVSVVGSPAGRNAATTAVRASSLGGLTALVLATMRLAQLHL